MRVTFTESAPPHTMFAPGAFDSQVGQCTPLVYGGQRFEDAIRIVIVSATVAVDGSSVEFVADVDEEHGLHLFAGDLSGYSLAE